MRKNICQLTFLCLFAFFSCEKSQENTVSSFEAPHTFNFKQINQEATKYRVLEQQGSVEINVPTDSFTIGSLPIIVAIDVQAAEQSPFIVGMNFTSDTEVVVSFNIGNGINLDTLLSYSVNSNLYSLNDFPDLPEMTYNADTEVLTIPFQSMMYTYFDDFKQKDDLSATFSNPTKETDFAILAETIRTKYNLMEGDTIAMAPVVYEYQ